ncbi:MAG: ATP-binding protein [Victivallales bacterium]|nr:ATP-binding protein [Victivallales bacterium]
MIGRIHEREELERLYSSTESEFVAVYGRRRVGKTYLIRETFEGRFAFSHTGLAGKSKHYQLKHFQNSLNEYDGEVKSCPSNWLDAFESLKKVILTCPLERKVVFIDEIPWMDTAKSEFLTALEGFWNGWASRRKDILFIVCGSAASWILKHLFRNRGGLHNRITSRIHLMPFSLSECESYVLERGLAMTRKDIAECYMALGGIPYYWHYLVKGMSLAQNFDRLFFSENAPMKYEYAELYSSLFRNATLYEKVVETLARKGCGMSRNELINALGLHATGKMSEILETLECSGFIRKYRMPACKSRDSIYQLMDNFTLFHFRFLVQGSEDEKYWENTAMSPKQAAWRGIAFEHLCLQHQQQIREALGISGIHTEAYAWQNRGDESGQKGAQIDLLLERADNVISVCEMKYTDVPFALDRKTLDGLLTKMSLFREVTHTRKALHLTMITSNGLVHNAYRNSVQAEITLDDLFEGQ